MGVQIAFSREFCLETLLLAWVMAAVLMEEASTEEHESSGCDDIRNNACQIR